MNAQILKIESRKRQKPLEIKSPRDFEFTAGSTISASVLIENPNISLYCLDPENKRALFVETDADIDLSKAPFYYQAQYENTIGLFAVSYDTLHQLANQINLDSKRLILIYSVGRCGSTLLSSALNQVEQIVNLSEVDIYAQLVMIRAQYGEQAGVNELLESCTKIFCQSAKPDTVAWAIKFRSFSIEIAELMFKYFPNAKTVFLYRDAESWLKSAFRAFLTPDDVNLSDYLAEMQAGLSPLVPLIEQYSNKKAKSLSKVEILTLMWLSVMERYLILHEQGLELFAVRYQELSTKPQEVLKAIFAHCGIPITDMTEVFKALEKDSQAGTVLSRENVQQKSAQLPENYLTEMEHILQAHPTIQIPDFIVPNTKCLA